MQFASLCLKHILELEKQSLKRISMELTDCRKTAKKLSQKNWQILTDSPKQKLTVKRIKATTIE